MKCVITGCALVINGRWVSGDLFDAGFDWLFNANVEVSGNSVIPAWVSDGEPFYKKQLRPDDWWERRGVFVIPKHKANMNDAAVQYLRSGT